MFGFNVYRKTRGSSKSTDKSISAEEMSALKKKMDSESDAHIERTAAIIAGAESETGPVEGAEISITDLEGDEAD